MLDDIIRSGSINDLLDWFNEKGVASTSDIGAGLLFAIRHARRDVVGILLSHGADPNSSLPDEDLPLHAAIEHGQKEIVIDLIKHGANVNLQDEAGWTPLQVAIDLEGDSASQADIEPSANLSRVLIDHGADPFLSNKEGNNAFDIARHYDHRAALRFLEGI